MKNLLIGLTVSLLLMLLCGCPDGTKKQMFYDAYFPTQAQNLVDVNTVYDDYNSALPETHFGKKLVFSSNRYTIEKEFNIVGDDFNAIWYQQTGELSIDNNNYAYYDNFINDLIKQTKTGLNEFGPLFISFNGAIRGANNATRTNFLLYSCGNDTEGYNGFFVYNLSDGNGNSDSTFGPFKMNGFSDKQQQYISFYGPTVESLDHWELNPNDFTEMYFDQSNGETTDIYKFNIPETHAFFEFLMDTLAIQKEEVAELNTNANDRCPFINGSFMVFSSDRPGGFGGYDLYYSKYENNQWSNPVNFGDKINSGFDEFRPVTAQVREFQNDLMIFSSNRDGGKGGFDLYYAGIEKINSGN